MERFYFKSSLYTGFFWDGDLLEHKTSPYQDIKVISHPEMGHTLILDDYIMVAEQDEHQYHELITHPNCLQLNNYNNALIIGGGDGLCAEEILKYPFKNLTLVEIDEEVSLVCRRYFQKGLGNTFEDTRFQTLYQDALAFFPTNERYDFIALDLNDPAEDFMHSHPLYSGSFYDDCKASLTEDGIMVVQVGCPHLFTKHFKRNVDLLKEKFKYVAIYGQYMRCYGTYQYFASCSDTIDVTQPNQKTLAENMEKLGISDLHLYNTYMHLAMLHHNNEVLKVLKGK